MMENDLRNFIRVLFRKVGVGAKVLRLKNWARQCAWSFLAIECKTTSEVTVPIEGDAGFILFTEVFVHACYDLPIQRLLSLPKLKRPVILDIGANVGYFSLRFIHLWRQTRTAGAAFDLVGFEASPLLHKTLSSRIKGQVPLPSTALFHQGLVGKRSGGALLSQSKDHGLNSIMSMDRDSPKTMMDFVDIEKHIPPGRIALLKCDIEGAELMFLENYPDLLLRTDSIAIELHPEMCDLNRCIALIKAAGLTQSEVITGTPNCINQVHLFTRKNDKSIVGVDF